MMSNFAYIRPKSLKDAVKQLSSEETGLLAGGTDLLGCLHDHVFSIRKMVSLSGLSELRGIKSTPDKGLRIGALTTIADVAGSTVVRERYPALSQAAQEVASPQLRNQGTIGGNLCQKPRCWYYRGEFHCLRKGGTTCYAAAGENEYHCIFGGGPCYIVHPSDTAPALAAYHATVRIAGPKNTRTIPVEKFPVLPSVDVRRDTMLERGEIVTEILLPPQPKGARSSFRKVRARQSWDFALAGAACVLNFNGDIIARASVVLSGAAPVPWRSKEAEDALIGRKLDPDVIAKAADAAVKNANPLEHNGYKVPLFRGLIQEQLAAIAKA